jgi:hypothetical protein
MASFCEHCGDVLEEGEFFCDKCGAKAPNLDTVPSLNARFAPFDGRGQNLPPDFRSSNQASQSQTSNSKSARKRIAFVLVLGAILIGIPSYFILIKGIHMPLYERYFPSQTTENTDENPHTKEPNAKGDTEQRRDLPATSTEPNGTKEEEPIQEMEALAEFILVPHAHSVYDEENQVVTVVFEVKLTNIGGGKAQDIMVYFDPDEGDLNVQELQIDTRPLMTIPIREMNVGQTNQMVRRFDFSTNPSFLVTPEYLEYLAMRFKRIPISWIWYENNKEYSDSYKFN